MERCQIRRRTFLDGVFEPWQQINGIGVRLTRIDRDAFAPSAPLAVISDGIDDLLWVPGELAVVPGSEAARALAGDDRFARREQATDDELVVRFGSRDSSPTAGIALVLDVLARFGAGGEVAPVHGFISHQKLHGGGDPESSDRVVERFDSRRGAERRILVLDTGLAANHAWTTPRLQGADVDPLAGLITPGYLGRAAGHGTFVGSLCLQVAPGATVEVARIANTEGFIDELTLAERIGRIGNDGAPVPDVVVMSFGGYSVKLGSFGTTGSGTSWTRPLLLQAAVRRLASRCPDLVVVASAGNNDSSDPCFPAAFAAEAELRGRVVSVGALDVSGYRWDWSNYGTWVTASTLGVRLRSVYVEGREDPSNDPDGRPEVFTSPSFATWTGTSFAAPLVAGRIVELQRALEDDLGRPVPATEAWRVLRASSKPQREGMCGVRVVVDGVSYA